MSIANYIPSLRLRTLPLSVSGIILGSGLALRGAENANIRSLHNLCIFALAVCTTLCLQILSNLSNELGDAQKGTDTDQQGREAYGLQAGTVTVGQMKRMIALFVGLSVVFGTALVVTAFEPFGSEGWTAWIYTGLFLGLGALAIIGAMTYTLGRHNYGYVGLGDLGVFLFFGLLSTMGAYFLQTQRMTAEVVWAAVAIGLPCVGVLNLNNVRDMDHDRLHGKRTFASLLGKTGGKIYHVCLLAGCLAILVCWKMYWPLAVLPLWLWHSIYVFRHDGHDLDKQMPVLMFSTLLVACLACI